MDYELLYASDYVKAADLRGKDVTKTIDSVVMEDLWVRPKAGGPAKQQRKPVVLFSDSEKKLVLNKTNAETIADVHGRETDGWKGKTITLFPTTTKVAGKPTPCIRIRGRSVGGRSTQGDE